MLVALLLSGPAAVPSASLLGGAAPVPLPSVPGDPVAATREIAPYGALHTIGFFGGEPNIAIGPAGDVYVTTLRWGWIGGSWQGGTGVFVRPGGIGEFVDRGIPDAGLGGFDEALAVGPDGSVWITGMYRPGPSFCASSTRGNAGGASWAETTPGICLANRIDRQWIAVDGAGVPWLSMHEVCCIGQHTAYRSLDGGVTYVPAGVITPAGGFPGNLFTDRERNMIYATSTCNVLGSRLAACMYGTRTDAPAPVWAPLGAHRITSTPPGLSHISGAVDDAGNLYLTWIDTGAATSKPSGAFLARSTDGGITWSTPHRVSGPGLAVFPWVAAGAEGKVAVAYLETTASGMDPNLVASSAEWHVKVATVTDWSTGTPQATITQLSTTPAKTGPVCTRGAACQSDRQLLDFFEAAVGPDGKLHVVWPDWPHRVMRVAEVDAALR